MTTMLNCEIDSDALQRVVGGGGVMETLGRGYAKVIGEDWDSLPCIAKSKIFDGIGRYVAIGAVTGVGYLVGKRFGHGKAGKTAAGAIGGLIGNMAGNVSENMAATKMFMVNSRECAK